MLAVSIFDIETASFDVESIRTQSANEKTATCVASFKSRANYKSRENIDPKEKSFGDYIGGGILADFSGDFRYLVELTDDKKKFFVKAKKI